MAHRILVIDDEKEFTDMLSASLTRVGGYEVRVENDSTKALSGALEFRPDVILLDFVMPGLDGGDVTAKLKGNPDLKDVPIILVSALIATGETTGEQGASSTGGTTIIAKPVKMNTLTRCIEEALEGREPTH